MKPTLYLGQSRSLDGGAAADFRLPAHHLVTHSVVVGMTGSGKTGLVTVMIEEALRASIPVLVIDVKGDLPNLLLNFPTFDAAALMPWVEPAPGEGGTIDEVARRLAEERKHGLEAFGVTEADLVQYAARSHIRVVTPGSDAGELLHVLSSLERRSDRWDTDLGGARAALSAAISLILRLLGRDADPARSKEHVLLSVVAEARLRAGKSASIGELLPEIVTPPLESIGALAVDEFLSKRARKELAAALNNLLASPSFESWRQGASLDVAAWMRPQPDASGQLRTPATVVSVAHVDDDERALVLGVLLEEILTWTRGLPGSRSLKALIVFDETYGFLPPHPANPPTKRPLVALLKQARAFGVGVVIATQNPMDLDYRALSNAGLWCLGRLQTDADRERVLDGLVNEAAPGQGASELGATLKKLRPRWFVVRDVHAGGSVFLRPRWAMSFMRGPMTGSEIRRARGG